MTEQVKQFMELLNLAMTIDRQITIWSEERLPMSLEDYGWNVEELRANKLVFSFDEMRERVYEYENADPDDLISGKVEELDDEFVECWHKFENDHKEEDYEYVLFFDHRFAKKFFYETLFKMYMEVAMENKLSAISCFSQTFGIKQ